MMIATYCPEDNKLRLYADGRLGSETYARVKAAGFKWAPKQELFVAPAWTPTREDLLLELCGEIDDEDYSPEERSADRAERFAGYRDKRAAEAGVSADRFDAGPDAFGHQSRARAARLAARHDWHRTYATTQWGKAEYWQERTRAVIGHAMYKSSARLRRGRLLTLEAEHRKHEAAREQYAARYAGWQRVAQLGPEADTPAVTTSYGIDRHRSTGAAMLAYTLANEGYSGSHFKHPRTGRESSLYCHMTDPADPITAREAAALWLAGRAHPDDPDTHSARWSRHYAARIEYEKAMIAAEGGMAGDADMEPGGWIGKHQIQKVNKSNTTGRVVSVAVWGTTSEYTKESGYRCRETRPALVNISVERLPENAYRPPTDEERAAFAAEQKARKAAEKATKPAAPPLVNPTDEDAEALIERWNAEALAKHQEADRRRGYATAFEPCEILRMTQAQYGQLSKGAYARLETRMLHACGRPARRLSNLWSSEGDAYDRSLGAPVCKLRMDGFRRHVVILTDKPQKPIPWPAPEPVEAEPEGEPFTLEMEAAAR